MGLFRPVAGQLKKKIRLATFRKRKKKREALSWCRRCQLHRVILINSMRSELTALRTLTPHTSPASVHQKVINAFKGNINLKPILPAKLLKFKTQGQ